MSYVIPLICSIILVSAFVPVMRKLAIRFNFVDRPNQRKIHAVPIPLLGGAAVFIAIILCMFIFDGWTDRTGTLLVGGIMLVSIGLLDDWYKTRGKDFAVWPRLIVYTIVSSVPLWFGIEIVGVTNWATKSMFFLPGWLVIVATMLWVFSLTNMINFIDGVDGLATGIALIASVTLFALALYKGQEGTALMAAVVAGACMAFLFFNFHPAKIFLGDAGATFLGFTLAVTAVDGAFKTWLVPILALGVPILDTTIVFTRRFLENKGLHKADKLHTHHSLMKWGLSQTQTVSFLYLVGVLFALLSVLTLVLLN
ncbi:UDP-phosphate N-acetylgalactosaminyl-1-phosphate transferase [Paenibacillus swuensis]|uniref:UDP-phosphate N-acetylgalactosaminyl-1-phosphate transferase n=1 Tax=Paenibacillus swuensis TaxID=1178515 RepID=A0A172TJ59_9BACL|nr:MraY family glycosyltransferase [Paenibacillus swuensis]ANE46823.1 UDP-phosphate N-acetylgalactosaminyl-1-phosphate transferase [Paenibacillus swuensis]